MDYSECSQYAMEKVHNFFLASLVSSSKKRKHQTRSNSIQWLDGSTNGSCSFSLDLKAKSATDTMANQQQDSFTQRFEENASTYIKVETETETKTKAKVALSKGKLAKLELASELLKLLAYQILELIGNLQS